MTIAFSVAADGCRPIFALILLIFRDQFLGKALELSRVGREVAAAGMQPY